MNNCTTTVLRCESYIDNYAKSDYNGPIVSKANTFLNKYRYSTILLRQLVITDFKLRYKGSALGYFWTLLRPLALFAVLYVVFVNFLKFGEGVPHFAVYLLLGVVLWNYFVEVTMNGLTAVVNRGDLMRKLSFPRYTIVLAGSFSALINVSINLLVVLCFALFDGVDFGWSALLMPLLLFELFVFGLAVAFFLSALFVRFRDINYVWEVVLQAGFYGTPIIYPISVVVGIAPAAAKLLMLSPVAQIIQDSRWALISPQTETIASIYGNSFMYVVPLGIVALILAIGTVYFKKRSPYFAEEV